MSEVSFVDTVEMRKHLKEKLFDGKVEIVFTKVDGTERKMLCTLSGATITEAEKIPKGVGVSPNSTYRVFDLDKNEWRSFRWDSLKKYTVV